MNDINWKIGGVGGMGAMGVGGIFARIMFKNGYHAVDYSEYNSIIKGGHNTFQVRTSIDPVYSISNHIDILLSLDEYTLRSNNNSMSKTGFIICDWALVKNKEGIDINSIIDIPFSMINKANGGDEIMKNIIGLGASISVMGVDKDVVKGIISDQFKNKGEDVINKNIVLFEAGFNYVIEKYSSSISRFRKDYGSFSKKDTLVDQIYCAGNEAIALAAIKSGIGYYAAYPMTPSSSILHFLAPLAKDFNFVVKHAEDEIAAINSAIGASFAGSRSMVATSGGGFSLMVEGFGMAAMTETPLVVALITRPGPSTGMPTWTDQGDLRFALHASQGEFLRLIFTPGDPQECYELTNLAFKLSEKYQIPSIVLSDKYLAEGHWDCSIDQKEVVGKERSGFTSQLALDRMGNYERYLDTPSGVTPRSIPGMKNGTQLSNSDEHDFYGYSDETAEMRNIQLNKRLGKKLKRLVFELPFNSVYGNSSSKLGIIVFGSMKTQMLETLKYNNSFKFLHIKCVSPFPKEEVSKFIESVDQFLVIENNSSGQLAGLITEYTGRKSKNNLLKDDGRPIYYEEILNFLKTNGY